MTEKLSLRLNKIADELGPRNLTVEELSTMLGDHKFTLKRTPEGIYRLRVWDPTPEVRQKIEEIKSNYTYDGKKIAASIITSAESALPYPTGATEIWYWKDKLSRDMLMGFKWLQEYNMVPDPENLGKTHVLMGKVAETDPDKIFRMMQGEEWSPNGEAYNFVEKSGSGHTSMSVGDIINLPSGECLMVDNVGFVDLWQNNPTRPLSEEESETLDYHIDKGNFKGRGGSIEGSDNALNNIGGYDTEEDFKNEGRPYAEDETDEDEEE